MSDRRRAVRIYRESLPVLVASLLGGVFAGLVLGSEPMRDAFRAYPGLLLALPAFLATRGNVYGAIGARVASGLHQGIVRPQFARDRRLGNAVAAALAAGIGVTLWIALLAWTALVLQPGRQPAPLLELAGVLFVAGVLTSVVLVAGLLGLLFAGYRRGLNPDNLVGPIVTTLGDVFGVVFLLLAAWLVGVLT